MSKQLLFVVFLLARDVPTGIKESAIVVRKKWQWEYQSAASNSRISRLTFGKETSFET